MIHQRWIDKQFGDWLETLAADHLTADPNADAAIVVRHLKRQRDKKVKLPQLLVEELTRTAGPWSTSVAGSEVPRRLCQIPAVLGKDDFLEKTAGRSVGL